MRKDPCNDINIEKIGLELVWMFSIKVSNRDMFGIRSNMVMIEFCSLIVS